MFIMNLLRPYTKQSFLSDLYIRINEIPMILKEAGIIRTFDEVMRKFDEVVYEPRHILMSGMTNGSYDVTDYSIEAISRVYFSNDVTVSNLTGEVGILPFISAQGGGIGLVDTLVDFYVMQRVINGLKRYTNTFDFTLWPPNAEGRVFLQVQNPGSLMIVEYLPFIDVESSVWMLYQKEKNFIDELFYRMVCYQNVQSQAQAVLLALPRRRRLIFFRYGRSP